MTKLLSIVWAALIVLAVAYFALLLPINKNPIERERDSVEGVYERWKKEEKIRREIESMQDEMYGDSIRRHRSQELDRRIDSILGY